MKLKPQHTDEEINFFLQAKMRTKNVFVVKVKTTRYYVIQSSYYEEKKKHLLKEWFEDTPSSAGHASRDAALYYTSFDEVEEVEREEGEINVLGIAYET